MMYEVQIFVNGETIAFPRVNFECVKAIVFALQYFRASDFELYITRVEI